MGDNRILSTGVLVRDPALTNVHVDVVNLAPNDTHTVTVEVFDWGVDQLWDDPRPVLVSPAGPTAIGPHTKQAFLAVTPQTITHYEIRITLPRATPLVVNCSAIDFQSGGRIIAGNTVRHSELVEVVLV
jgi:hypothetical protein